MRQFIVASHAHFASGIVESIGLLSGERENVHALSMYVDGNEDLTKEAAAILDGFAADDEVVVCTDLFGGSVNNEFTKIGPDASQHASGDQYEPAAPYSAAVRARIHPDR